MRAKSPDTKKEWVDPDDAPELDDEWFRNAHVYIGDTLIKRGVGRPPIKNAKEMLSLRIDSCLLYTSPSPRDRQKSRMPSSA